MVSERKVKMLERIVELASKYNTIGIIDMYKMPTKEFKEMKEKLGKDIVIVYAKKKIAKLALEKVGKEGLSKLVELFPNQFALVFSNKNCFEVYAKMSKLRQKTFAKGGEIAEEDIVLRAGPTNIPAGPAIGEFARLKIPAGVEGGRIAIKKDTVVAKKGEAIKPEVAGLLKKLNIPSVTIKLKPVAFYENGNIFGLDALKIVDEIEDLLAKAYSQAMNLSINISYPTKDNIEILLAKASMEAQALKNALKVE